MSQQRTGQPNDHVAVSRSRCQMVGMMLWYCFWPEITVSTITRTIVLILMSSFTSVISASVNWFDCFDTGSELVVWAFPAVVCRTPTYLAWSALFAFHILFWALTIISISVWLYYHSAALIAIQSVTLTLITASQSVHPIAVADAPSVNNNVQTMRSVYSPSSSRPRLMADGASINANEEQRIAGGNNIPLSVIHIKPFASVALQPQHETDDDVQGRLPVPLLGWIKWSWFWPAYTAYENTVPCPQNLLDEPVCASQTSMRLESRRQYAFRAVYGALFDAFTESAVAWNMMILTRRWLLIIIAVIFSRYFNTFASAKYLSFAILHGAIYAIHTYYQPYTAKIMNVVEQAGIVVHIAIAGILCAFPNINDTTIQSVIISITAISVFTALFFVIAHHVGMQYMFRSEGRRSEHHSLSLQTADSHFVRRAELTPPSALSSRAPSSSDSDDSTDEKAHVRASTPQSGLSAGLLDGMSDDDMKSSGAHHSGDIASEDNIAQRRTSLSRLLGLAQSPQTHQRESLEMKSLTNEQNV